MRGYNENSKEKKKCCICAKEIPIGEFRMIMDWVLMGEAPVCVIPYIKDFTNYEDPRDFPKGTQRILNFIWENNICEFKCMDCFLEKRDSSKNKV